MKNLLFVILFIYFPSIYCQTSNDSVKKIWGTGGIAGYHSTSSEGVGFNISAEYLKNRNYWKLRFINVYEFNLDFFSNTIPEEKFYDIGLLYGTVTETKIIRLSISGGLGVFGGIKRGPLINHTTGGFLGMGSTYYYREDHIFSPAIPLEIELSLIPSKYVGIGISGFSNINFENSLIGFIIKLELGNIR